MRVTITTDNGSEGFRLRESIRATLLNTNGCLDTPAAQLGIATGFIQLGTDGIVRVTRHD